MRTAAILLLATFLWGCQGDDPLGPEPPLKGDGGGLSSLHKSNCTVTVLGTDAVGSIQAAVDAASSGDVICLSGTFDDVPTVTIGTSGITLTSASAAILDGGSGPAFRLADGLSGVTIEGLEIKNRTGFRGGGIEAWDRSTSNITVRNNYLRDNSYSGVLVGSEGGFIHTNWMVKDNTVTDNGDIGIELTNCKSSNILNNNVAGSGFADIVVQARRTSVGSVDINAVKVLHNTVGGAGPYGIYVLAYEGLTGWPFTSVGATSVLTNVTVNNNTFTGSSYAPVLFWAYNPGGTASNATINHNDITCTTSSAAGVMVWEAGGGTVKNVKVVKNSFSGCNPNVVDTGTDTKLPPGPFLP